MPSTGAATPSPFPTLTTPRLVLREITLDDGTFWLRIFSDPETVELTAYEAPRDLEGAQAEILQYAIRPFQEHTGIRWGITLRGTDDLIGTVGYHGWAREGANRARVGYDLLRERRRQGIMTEAMRAILPYGFNTMSLNRIEALTDPRNVASMRLLERVGFHREGVLRENTFFRGGFVDDVLFSLLAREWRESAGAKR